jgi:hypothetical protein
MCKRCEGHKEGGSGGGNTKVFHALLVNIPLMGSGIVIAGNNLEPNDLKKVAIAAAKSAIDAGADPYLLQGDIAFQLTEYSIKKDEHGSSR